MREFLNERFTGGKGEEKLVLEALRVLETGDYEMADVLIISDFILNSPSPKDIDRVASAKSKGTWFYGLQINSPSTAYDPLDKNGKHKRTYIQDTPPIPIDHQTSVSRMALCR